MDQVIRCDGRIIRLIPSNKVKDPKGCPIVSIKSDDRGFYLLSTAPGSFQATDVTRLWRQ